LFKKICNSDIKVLHITHLYPRYYDPSHGIAIKKQIDALKEKGLEQKIISPVAYSPFPINCMKAKWRAYANEPTYRVIDDIDVFYPRFISFPKALFFSSSGSRLFSAIKNAVIRLSQDFSFDLIHAHMAIPDGYAAVLLGENLEKPVVLTFQATDLDITANRNKKCFRKLKKVFSSAEAIIAPTPRLEKDLLEKFGIRSEVCGYGVGKSDLYKKKSECETFFDGRQIILSASRLIPTKGIELNIKAIKILKEKYTKILYLIIGDGPERKRLEQLVQDLDLSDYVRFLGQLAHKEVMRYMASSEIFSLPSWQETFGLVYIEAMAHGVPVIGIRGQGIDGIVDGANTGLLAEPLNLESLVKNIEFLLSQPEVAKEIGERGRALAMDHFTWDKVACKTCKIYNKLLNRIV